MNKLPPIPLEEQAARQREIISKAMGSITLPKLATTVVSGKYHGCGYEYSPTIWIHTEGHGPDLSQTESQWPDFNLDVIAIGQLPSVNYGDRAEAEKAQADKVARVVAMVDRANAYQKLASEAQELVLQLRKDGKGGLTKWQASRRIEALLRELGEAND